MVINDFLYCSIFLKINKIAILPLLFPIYQINVHSNNCNIIINFVNSDSYFFICVIQWNILFQCPYLRYDGRNNTKNIFRSDLKFRIASDSLEYSSQNRDVNVICDIDENFGQYGVYSIHVDSNSCQVETLKEPKNIYLRKYFLNSLRDFSSMIIFKFLSRVR